MTAKKREKKKIPFLVRILIIAIFLFTFFLCSVILSNSSGSMANNDENSSVTSNDLDSVLIDDDKLKVSFIGANDQSSLGVFYVTLKIENKTDSVITINLENASVDGETIPLITTGVPLVIQPGNSGQTGFIFSMVNLSISSMDEAEKATFQVVARDNDSFAVVYTSEMITINLH